MSGRYQEGYVQGCRKGREDCEAEIERLRAALTEIAENAGSLPEAQSIAIDALKR
jgi:uncharacterized Zn finger protein